MQMRRSPRCLCEGMTLLLALLAGIYSTGCQATKPSYSGFLGDYGLLQPGGEGEALLVYRNPKADFADYDKVLLDQVTILGAGEAVVLGSAFHIPSRVQLRLPEPEPSSRTAAPHLAWRSGSEEFFDRDSALRNWGVEESSAQDDEPSQ